MEQHASSRSRHTVLLTDFGSGPAAVHASHQTNEIHIFFLFTYYKFVTVFNAGLYYTRTAYATRSLAGYKVGESKSAARRYDAAAGGRRPAAGVVRRSDNRM
ncbi:unnamed protein product, partial [Brenthis ino]